MRRAPRVRRPSWRVLVGVVGVLALVGGAVAVLWLAPFLRVETVEYRTEPARMELLREAAAATEGQALVEVDARGMEKRILDTLIFESAEVSRSWPSTLVVSATPRESVVAVTAPGVRGHRLVDDDGVAFETVASVPEGVPTARVADLEDRAALATLATVTGSLTPELLAQATDLDLDRSGQVSMDLDGVLVNWGGSEESRLKTAVVRELVGQEGVRRVDVSAPLAPVTSAERTPAASATRGPVEGPTLGSGAGALGGDQPDSTGEATESAESAGSESTGATASPTEAGAEGDPAGAESPTDEPTD